MFDDADDHEYEELDYFDFPGSEVGGYNILYPGDPIRQAETLFSGETEPEDDTDLRPQEFNRTPASRLQSSRILVRVFLFILCLAFPPILPVVWLLRRSRRRG